MNFKTLSLSCWLFLLFSNFYCSQEIELVKLFGGYKTVYEGKNIKLSKLRELMLTNPNTYGDFNKYTTNATIAGVVGFAGGFLIGWPVGESLFGDDPNWNLAIAGVSLVAVTIPFEIGANKRLKKAVNKYTADLVGTMEELSKPIEIVFQRNGIIIKF